jgi:DNA-binding MarR family transcriptional regulator
LRALTKDSGQIVKASASHLTDRLYRVEQHRRALLSEALSGADLSLTQWIALCTLARSGPSSMTELAQASAMDRTSLTRTIDNLIPRGLVARYTPPTDRRTVMVEATPEGRRLAEVIGEEVEALERQWFAGLTNEEQQRLSADLEKILAGLPGPGRKAKLVDPASRRT